MVTVEDCDGVWSSVTTAVFGTALPLSISACVTVVDAVYVTLAPTASDASDANVVPSVGSVTSTLVSVSLPVLATTTW